MKKLIFYILLSLAFVGIPQAQSDAFKLLILFDTGDDYQLETKTYLASLTTPLSKVQEVRINTFIKMLKDSLQITTLSQRFDVMYLLANETAEAGLRNLVKRLHDATNVNATSFTALEGFTGDGISMYLNTNYNTGTQGIKVSRDSISSGHYIRNAATNATYSYGATSAGGGLRMWSSINGGILYFTLNGGGAPSAGAGLTTQGFFSFVRDRADTIRAYRNGSILGNPANASVGLVDNNIYLLCYNSTGTATGFSNAQMSFFYVANKFTATENGRIYNCIQWYMTELGKQV